MAIQIEGGVRLAVFVIVGVVCVSVGVQGIKDEGELLELSLIHINDFHARFEQTSLSSGTCQAGKEDSCVGGIARVVTSVNGLVNERPNAVFLNAGDNFQGTLWYTKFKWNVTAQFMNKLPHDALTLGNHEFDDKIEGVVPFLENVKAPFVVANMDDSEEPTIQGKYNKSIIIERAGRKIGILGYVIKTFYELSSTGKLKFLDEIESVTAEAANLKSQGVDIIIALSHAGLDVDREVAAAVADVDVIVGGHSHSFLYTGNSPPGGQTPVDDYPVVVKQSNNHTVLIVQAYAYSKYVGNLTVWFDKQGEVAAWEGEPILLDKTVAEDPKILEELKPWKQEVEKEAKEVIGSTKVFLDQSNGACRKGECNIGNFITDAFINEYTKLAQPGSWTKAAIAIVNSGGIRASIEETGPGGNITYEDLMTAQPFANTVDTLELQGKHLLEVLEFSVSRSYAHLRGNGRHKRDLAATEFSGQGFLQLAGVQVTFNLSLPVMQRVAEVKVRCADCRVPEYEPIDLEKWYSVAVVSYIAGGGDGYTVIRDNARNHNIGRVDYEILMDYFAKISPVTTGIEDKIQLIQ